MKFKGQEVISKVTDDEQESSVGRPGGRDMEKEKYSREEEICAQAHQQMVAVEMKKSDDDGENQ